MAVSKKTGLELTVRNGYWSKKIRVRGQSNYKTFYFGKSTEIEYMEALEQYRFELPFLREGMDPYAKQNEGHKTVGDLVDQFLQYKKEQHQRDQLSAFTLQDYVDLCDDISAELGRPRLLISLEVEDFQRLRRRIEIKPSGKPYAISVINRKIGYIQTVFKFATLDNRLTDRNFPMQSIIKGVPKMEFRKYKAHQNPRSLTAAEIRQCMDNTNPRGRAMILLAINGGMNNSDIGKIELNMFEPMPDNLDYPRRKTWVNRVIPLWEETKTAVSEYIKTRPRSAFKNLFIADGGHYFGDFEQNRNGISKWFSKLLRREKLYLPGKNFGALRTTFANIGLELEDDLAVKALMGHDEGSTLYTNYATTTYIPRLKKVTDHVRSWLFSQN